VALLIPVCVACFYVVSRLWPELLPKVQVASFDQAFKESTLAEGWRYLWNPQGPIGSTSNYVEMKWNGRSYGPDEDDRYPRPLPGRYMKLGQRGGHPGSGSNQVTRTLGRFDRYAIAAFTAPNSGVYNLGNTRVCRHDGDLRGNVDLRVFMNEREVGPTVFCDSRDGLPFDRELGRLSAGDTIYVAVGPNGIDTYDAFRLDFAVVRRFGSGSWFGK